MFYVLYKDQNLTDVLGVCPVGEISSASLYGGNFANPYGQVLGENRQMYIGFDSSGSDVVFQEIPSKLALNFDPVQGESATWVYISKVLRIGLLFCVRGDGYRYIGTPHWEWYDSASAQWKIFGPVGSLDYANWRRAENLKGIGLSYAKKNAISVQNTYRNGEPALCVTLWYTIAGQTGESRWDCSGYIAPYDFLLSPDEVPSNKPTQTAKIGGRGAGSYPDNGKESLGVGARNAAFSYASTNGVGVTYYKLDAQKFNTICAQIYDKSWFGNSDKNFNIKDAIVSVFNIPRVPALSQTEIGVRLGSYNPGVAAKTFADRFVSGEFTQEINNATLQGYGWEDFSDFTQTKMSVYLPFVGRINLDPSWFAQGKFCLEWILDCYNGNITYWISGYNLNRRTPILYGTYSGNCAVTIPWAGAVNTGLPDAISNVSGAISHGAQAMVAMQSGNPVGAGSAANAAVDSILDTVSALNGATKAFLVDKSGIIDTHTTTASPFQAVLEIEMPNQVRPETYVSRYGIAGDEKDKIKNFGGYTIFSDAKLTFSGATDAEKSEILALLRSGVYLPEIVEEGE